MKSNCPTCTNEFKVNYKGHTYCSRNCSIRAYKDRKNKDIDIQQIILDYTDKQMSVHEISKKHNVNSNKVSYLLKLHGVPISSVRKGKKSRSWKGYGEISGRLWFSITRSAEERGIEFNITPEEAWLKYKEQNGKCSLTKLPMNLECDKNSGSHFHSKEMTASLDRIDSNKGYEIGNIQWVLKKINRMKWILSQEEFIEICTLVADHNRYIAG